ncbi:UNVERIFIED_CONTAM: hypothetical protein RF648_22345, partial [Kocuria sp. CPCC 205274]
YFMHYGVWPECIINKDHNKGNWHIDNLMPADAQQSNMHRKFDMRTYSIIERVTATGKRKYYPILKYFDKNRSLGSFTSESDAIYAAITARKILHGDYLAKDLKNLL